MELSFSTKKLNKINRINEVIDHHFNMHPAVKEVAAKDLMPVFIEKGIFYSDKRKDLSLRLLLRQLNTAGKLDMLKSCRVVRKKANTDWYFLRRVE